MSLRSDAESIETVISQTNSPGRVACERPKAGNIIYILHIGELQLRERLDVLLFDNIKVRTA